MLCCQPHAAEPLGGYLLVSLVRHSKLYAAHRSEILGAATPAGLCETDFNHAVDFSRLLSAGLPQS
jgi:hypothetical protein